MVDLALVVIELVLRGGRSLASDMQVNYAKDPAVLGLSVVFHPGYDVDALARSGHFPNGAITYATVAQLEQALAMVGYQMRLIATPSVHLLDHHSLLVVNAQAQVELQLPNVAAQALARVFGNNVLLNPYRQP